MDVKIMTEELSFSPTEVKALVDLFASALLRHWSTLQYVFSQESSVHVTQIQLKVHTPIEPPRLAEGERVETSQ